MLAAHLAGLGCLKGNSFGFKGAGIPSNFSPPRDGFCFHHKRNLKMFKGKGSPQIISNHQKKSETTTKKKKIRIVFWTFKTFKTFRLLVPNTKSNYKYKYGFRLFRLLRLLGFSPPGFPRFSRPRSRGYFCCSFF